MAEATDFEADAFLKLLTDALRAGPASPQWQEAVSRVRAGAGGAENDEYRLLVQAREDLENGKEFRTVRAGPGFTRKLMESIEKGDEGQARSASTATIIALVAGAVIVGVIAIVAVLLMRQGPQGVGDDLAKGIFSRQVAYTDFSTAANWESDWRKFGTLPVAVDNGLRVASGATTQSASEPRGGGLVAINGVSASEPIELEAVVRVERPSDLLAAQFFVGNEAAPGAVGAGEFACWVQSGQVSVVDTTGSPAASERLKDAKGALVHITLRLDKENALVMCDGKTVYAARHGLSPDKVRYVGVRLLMRGTEKADAISVTSLRLSRKQ